VHQRMKAITALLVLSCLPLIAPIGQPFAAHRVQAQQVRVIEPTGQWVTDQGDFLSSAEERLLTAKLSTYADTTSTQIVVVTVSSLGGYAPVDYATQLGREWSVGQGDSDNGIVLLVSREEREVFIATGFGMEGSVTDAVAGRIVRNIIVPAFRDARFHEGISGGVDAIMMAAAGEFDADDIAPSRDGTGGVPVALIFIFIIFFFFLISVSVKHGGGGGPGSGRKTSRGGFPLIIWGGGSGWSSGRSGGFGGGGFGGGGFSGGGGSFGGGGAGGGW